MKYQSAPIVVAIAFMSVQVLFGCRPVSPIVSTPLPAPVLSQAQATATNSNIIVTGPVAASYVTAQSIEQLVIQSKVIIIGSMTGLAETVNMARNVNDITQPDPNILIVGQIYDISAKRYLKGSGASTIDVVQPEAYLFENTPRTPENISAARKNDNHIAIQPNIQYLFFLEPLQGFAGKSYFTGVRHPWRFVVPDTGNAEPESPWPNANQVFPSRPSTTLISEVEFWVNGGKPSTATPGPVIILSPAYMPTIIPITPVPNPTKKAYP